uniref:Uncharacterized protein LOC113794956 n=1 Tax=Dermatophagoides pteronyssinus TaxID=6956 RepID=A0A6P6Y8P0_DERPT|nr:uncharacterized protein LOC113794956 [Dermatophagoides pteronyssinus]
MANIPLNIMCIYDLVFRYDSLNNRFMYLGFSFSQIFVLSNILTNASTINFSSHQFKRQLPIIQLYMKELTIKWQINEFYERLTTTDNGFGFYLGRIAIINYRNTFQLNSLNKMINDLFVNRRHIMNSRLNYLRQLVWRQFQRQHQHMTYCMMYSGHDLWNDVYFIGIMANIPLNIMCIYNLVFRNDSLNNQFMYLGFLISQMFVLSAIMVNASTMHFSANQFKRQLPIIQLGMKKPSIKWQVNEFYERLTTTEIGFGFYCGRIGIINYHNSFHHILPNIDYQ